MSNTEVTTQEKGSPAYLLELAIEKGTDINQLEKLMDLQQRWQRQKANRAYLEAVSKFQSNCPDIKKTKAVSFGMGKAAYKYAPLGDIAKQIRKIMSDCGLSYRWEIAEKEKLIECSCIVSHIEGHSERTTMTAEHDGSGSKNAIQQRGSTITYLQRYTLICALGVTTADEDADGVQSKKISEITEQELKDLLDLNSERLTDKEYKRAKEVIRKKETASYGKLKAFLLTKNI